MSDYKENTRKIKELLRILDQIPYPAPTQEKTDSQVTG